MKVDAVARMIVEGLAFQLGELPAKVTEYARNAGCDIAAVRGVEAALRAYKEATTPQEHNAIVADIESGVREGLSQLDRKPDMEIPL